MNAIDETAVAGEAWADAHTLTNPVVPDEFEQGASELKSIYSALTELLRLPDDDDDCPVSRDTFEKAETTLSSTAYLLQQVLMPPGTATTDSSGGIRVEWWQGDHGVILAVKSDADQYIFRKLPGDGRGVIIRPVYPAQLASFLEALERLVAAPNE